MKKFKNFIVNCWQFRKELQQFQPYDWVYNLKMFRRSLELTRDYIAEHGNEEMSSRVVKLHNMNFVISTLYDFEDDTFIQQAEEQLGYVFYHSMRFEKVDDNHYKLVTEHDDRQEDRNNRIGMLADELEKESWEQLWNTLNKHLRGWWD